jgi:16S rRNA (cytidine1402-2'-O)-methyltransferase
MNRQQSFQNNQPTLYLVATPIGHLSDITYRAVEILQEVDVIYCEDTRTSGVLLKHYNIKKPLKSYHEYNKDLAKDKILSDLENGKNVALISDAGMPLISDPGYVVVQVAIEAGYNVVSIPGVSASLTALSVSGIAPYPFLFYGFLDAKQSKRQTQLESLYDYPYTLIFYESPHRIHKTIQSLYDVLGERPLVLARELTKKYEEVIRGTTKTLIDINQVKGEMVLVVGGYQDNKESVLETTILEDIEALITSGMTSKDAIKQVAKQRQLPKNDVYMEYHRSNKE